MPGNPVIPSETCTGMVTKPWCLARAVKSLACQVRTQIFGYLKIFLKNHTYGTVCGKQ